jgi:signal peptidase I
MGWVRANKGFLMFLLLFGLFRTAVADWNPIPSASMHPNLLEGDVVLVNRLAYNVKLPLTDVVLAHTGDPKQGDIVTFSSPRDGTRLIKRVAALPGDVVEMRQGALYINDRRAAYRQAGQGTEALQPGMSTPYAQFEEAVGASQRRVQYLPERGMARNFGPVVIPPGHYLMLGDNRDNSVDSRFIGLVPRERLIGRAERVLVSADIEGDWLPRTERFAKPLN